MVKSAPLRTHLGNISEEKAYSILSELAIQMQMNEMEITYWSLWLGKCNWAEKQISQNDLLTVTALQIKVSYFE